MWTKSSRCRQGAFTLADCLVTIAIMAILTGWGTPPLMQFIERQRADAAAYGLLRQINTARALAVHSGRQATFCGVDKTGRCTRDNIENFMVFRDVNYNHQLDSDETVVSLHQPPRNLDFYFRASNQTHVTFNPNGSARQFGNVTFCNKGEKKLIRRISFTRPGRPYLMSDRDRDGVLEDTSGKVVNCPPE